MLSLFFLPPLLLPAVLCPAVLCPAFQCAGVANRCGLVNLAIADCCCFCVGQGGINLPGGK